MRQALICFYCHLFANVRQQQCSEVTEVVRNYRQKMPWAWHWFFSAWTHKISWTRHKGYQTTGANVCDFVCPALFVFFMLKSAMKHKQTAFGQMRSSQSTRHNIKSHVINSFLTVFDTASLYSVKHCLLLPAVPRVSVKHFMSMFTWCHPDKQPFWLCCNCSVWGSAYHNPFMMSPNEQSLWLGPNCCLLPVQAHQLGFTPIELDCSAAAPQSSVCCGLHIVYHMSMHCCALCEDDGCFSCLVLQPLYTQAVHTQTQASPVGTALLNVFGSMETEATHMHLAGSGEGQPCCWSAITKKSGQTFYPPNLKNKKDNFKSMVFAIKIYCIC